MMFNLDEKNDSSITLKRPGSTLDVSRKQKTYSYNRSNTYSKQSCSTNLELSQPSDTNIRKQSAKVSQRNSINLGQFIKDVQNSANDLNLHSRIDKEVCMTSITPKIYRLGTYLNTQKPESITRPIRSSTMNKHAFYTETNMEYLESHKTAQYYLEKLAGNTRKQQLVMQIENEESESLDTTLDNWTSYNEHLKKYAPYINNEKNDQPRAISTSHSTSRNGLLIAKLGPDTIQLKQHPIPRSTKANDAFYPKSPPKLHSKLSQNQDVLKKLKQLFTSDLVKEFSLRNKEPSSFKPQKSTHIDGQFSTNIFQSHKSIPPEFKKKNLDWKRTKVNSTFHNPNIKLPDLLKK